MQPKFPLHILLLICLCSTSVFAENSVVPIGNFSEKSLDGWQKKIFSGETSYAFIEDAQKGWVLQAKSEGTASGLLKEKAVDLSKTPYLNWSWKVELLPDVKDEKTEAGDDYAARVYVIFNKGFWFWKTHALNYVWNSNYQRGESWANSFTSNAQMVALQSKQSPLGVWISEKRNIQDDILNFLGTKLSSIEAIAIMTDTDNSGGRAAAYYGDIFFSSR